MSDLILRHPWAFITLVACLLAAAWELWAHALMLSEGYTGAASWSWWIRPIAEALA